MLYKIQHARSGVVLHGARPGWLISCTEYETYAHVGLRDGGPVFRAPPCTTYWIKFCHTTRLLIL